MIVYHSPLGIININILRLVHLMQVNFFSLANWVHQFLIVSSAHDVSPEPCCCVQCMHTDFINFMEDSTFAKF